MSDPSHINPALTPPDHQSWPQLALDIDINEDLVLTTLEGGEDFLVSDLATISESRVISRRPAEVTVAVRGNLHTLHQCRLFTTAAIPLPGATDHEPDLAPLQMSLRTGILQTLTTTNPLRFRVGVRDSGLRKHVIGRIESSLGWTNEPSAWDVNLTPRRGRWEAQPAPCTTAEGSGLCSASPGQLLLWSLRP